MKRPSLASIVFGALLVSASVPACVAPVERDDAERTEEALAVEVMSLDMPLAPDDGLPLAAEPDDEVSRAPWTQLGVGVAYKKVGDGPNVILLYGGYSALDEWSQRWTSELFRAKGKALGVGHLYAMKGPNQAGYQNREIQNSKLCAHLAQSGVAAAAQSLVVIAHSSGAFVSNELLNMVKAGRGGVPLETIGKVHLFNLDGGGANSAEQLRALASARWVYACDGAINRCSKNAQGMKNVGSAWTSIGGAFEVDARGSGCSRTSSGGLWCLHDTVVTTRPHNPDMYDLKRDYTDFSDGRRVVTSYLDVLQAPRP